MTDVDKLTDEQLRTKLLEFGFPVMPVTGTTRKVMAKKLKLLLENKKKNDGRRSLGQFSSEEESDVEVKVQKKAEKNRRATMGDHAMQPPSTRLTQRKATTYTEIPDVRSPPKSVQKEVIVRSTRTVRTTQDEFDTGSESESDVINKAYDISSGVNDYRSDASKSPYQSHSSTISSVTSDKNHSTVSSPRHSSFFTTANAAEERLNQIRSRLSLSQTDYTRPTYSSPSSNKMENETPFLSNFTKRLSQLSPATAKNADYDYNDDIIKEHDTNGSTSYSRSYMTRPLRSRDTYAFRPNQTSRLKNNIVPITLLVIVFVFFVFVIFAYMGIKSSDTPALDASGYMIPVCENLDIPIKRGVNCVPEDEVEDALRLFGILQPYLMKLSVDKECSNPNLRNYATESEIVHFIRDNYAVQDEHEIVNDLKNVEALTFKNPSWKISVIQLNSTDDPISEQALTQNMEQVVFNKDVKTTSLVILQPSLPWRCNIYNVICLVFKSTVFISCCVGLFYLGNIMFKYYKLRKTTEHNEVVAMVERIIDILQSQASETDDNIVVINHVRDLILPVLDRKKKQKVWSKAVEFIEENESRVRTEVKEIQGEPFKVWRWLGSAKLMSPAKNKSWQGQAFETQIGSVNSLPCSPTPCLKIRGMVEDGDRNTLMIKEAVLSKCADKCRILHCGIDTSSKCVYLKCADPSDAAVAYRNLHGWWYAGHLVTVKYLRLERYMQRFPDSQVKGPPFLKAAAPVGEWSN